MAAALEFDPFNKVSGELLISDVLNAFLVLANFIRGGLSINKRGGFSFNNSKTGAVKKHRADLPPFRVNFVNTHDDDTADPERKKKAAIERLVPHIVATRIRRKGNVQNGATRT